MRYTVLLFVLAACLLALPLRARHRDAVEAQRKAEAEHIPATEYMETYTAIEGRKTGWLMRSGDTAHLRCNRPFDIEVDADVGAVCQLSIER